MCAAREARRSLRETLHHDPARRVFHDKTPTLQLPANSIGISELALAPSHLPPAQARRSPVEEITFLGWQRRDVQVPRSVTTNRCPLRVLSLQREARNVRPEVEHAVDDGERLTRP